MRLRWRAVAVCSQYCRRALGWRCRDKRAIEGLLAERSGNGNASAPLAIEAGTRGVSPSAEGMQVADLVSWQGNDGAVNSGRVFSRVSVDLLLLVFGGVSRTAFAKIDPAPASLSDRSSSCLPSCSHGPSKPPGHGDLGRLSGVRGQGATGDEHGLVMGVSYPS